MGVGAHGIGGGRVAAALLLCLIASTAAGAADAPDSAMAGAEALERRARELDAADRGADAASTLRTAVTVLSAAPDADLAARLAGALRGYGDHHAAELATRLALDALPAGSSANDDARRGALLDALGDDLRWQRRDSEAATAFAAAVAADERRGEHGMPALAAALEHLGTALAAVGQTNGADAALRRAAISRDLIGGGADALARIGTALFDIGDCEAAARAHRAALARTEDAEAATRADLFNRLGLDLYWGGDPAAAAGPHRQALALRLATLGRDHPLTAAVRVSLIYDLADADAGAEREAEVLARDSVAAAEAGEDPWSGDIAAADAALGHVLRRRGRADESAAVLRDALAICAHSCAAAPPLQARVMIEMAATLDRMGRHRDAAPLAAEAVALLDSFLGPAHPQAAGLRRVVDR